MMKIVKILLPFLLFRLCSCDDYSEEEKATMQKIINRNYLIDINKSVFFDSTMRNKYNSVILHVDENCKYYVLRENEKTSGFSGTLKADLHENNWVFVPDNGGKVQKNINLILKITDGGGENILHFSIDNVR